MKKVFSLILAVAMVLSLASVAFAANVKMWDVKASSSSSGSSYAAVAKYDNGYYYLYDKDTHLFTPYAAATSTSFGKVAYFPLLASTTSGWAVVADDKSVSSLTLTYTIEEGASFVKDISIVKKFGYLTDSNITGLPKEYVKNNKDGVTTNSDATSATDKFNGYYIAVTTQGSATASKYVSGIITLSGKTGSEKIKDEAVHFDLTLAWKTLTTSSDSNNKEMVKLLDGTTTYLFAADANTGKEYKFSNTTETNKQDFTYTVDMVASEKVVLLYDDDAVKAIEDANEEAGISFFNFHEASFKRAGTLLFPADLSEDSVYFYEVLADGSLKNLSSTYDEEEEAFSLKVKKLGQYCVSDLPLVDAEGTVAAVAGAVNPTTGAIA